MPPLAEEVLTVTRRTRMRWVVAGLIFLIYGVAAADRANLGFALPFIRREFSMSNSEAGALISMFLYAYAAAQLPSGIVVSRYGVRGIFTAAMLLTSVFTGLMGTAGSLVALKLYRLGLGLVEGPLPVAIATTINNWFPPREKGTASGIFLSAVKFGPVAVPPVCALIIGFWGWREIFLLFALPGLALAAVWWVFVPDRPSQSRCCSAAEARFIAASDPRPDPAASARPRASFVRLDRWMQLRAMAPMTTTAALFRSWNMWGCALGYSFQLGISNVLLAWIPTYLLTVKKFSVAGSGLVASAPWVGAVLGNILGGWLSDRVLGQRRKPGMLFSALATAAMMLLLIHSPADATTYGVLLFVTGVLLSIGFSAYMSYPMNLVAREAFPVASAIVNMGGQLGGATAPLIVGMLLDKSGWNSVFLLMAVGSLCSFLTVLTLVEPVTENHHG